MTKEKKENPKVIFEDDCMVVFAHEGCRIVKFRSEMKGKFNVELESKENPKKTDFSVNSKKGKPISIFTHLPLDIPSRIVELTLKEIASLNVDTVTSLIVKEVQNVKIENFHCSLNANSIELKNSVVLCSQKSLISIPHSSSGLYVHLKEDDEKSRDGAFQTYLSFGTIGENKSCCNVVSNLETHIVNTAKVVLKNGFDGKSIICEKVEGKTKGSFEYISGPFGKIIETEQQCCEKSYAISESHCLDIVDPKILQVSHQNFSFNYFGISSGITLLLNNLFPFELDSKSAGDGLSFNVDKSNGFKIKSYKDQCKEFSCSYDQDRGALIFTTPLLALDSYLETKETDFVLKNVEEQKLNLVLRSSKNDINIKSDNGFEKNRFHINLDGFMPKLIVRGDKVVSSNINMNIRGRDNYVESIVVSEDQNEAFISTMDQLRGKSSMSNT